jgi:hypothetical protein
MYRLSDRGDIRNAWRPKLIVTAWCPVQAEARVAAERLAREHAEQRAEEEKQRLLASTDAQREELVAAAAAAEQTRLLAAQRATEELEAIQSSASATEAQRLAVRVSGLGAAFA